MNLLDIINEELDDDENVYVLEEGLFDVSPAVAMFTFKDDLVHETGSLAKKIFKPLGDEIGYLAAGIEKVKAKTLGKSGFGDNATVYKLTKKQKEVLSYIYQKYGPDMVNKIEAFRKNILPYYQIIKRGVAKNYSLSNKELHGMTKEEYYKYRESGRRKIEAMGSFFRDSKSLGESRSITKQSLDRARKVLNDFKEGKIIDLTSSNVERILDDAGLGRGKLYGWSEGELEKTATKIKEIEGWLKDPERDAGNGLVRISYGKNDHRGAKQSRAVLENTLAALYEHGYSYAMNKSTDTEGRRNKGSFKDAFSTFLLRREEIKSMKSNMTNEKFKKYYEKILQDAVDSANRIYKEKIGSYSTLKSKSELNKMEKKIWGLKLTGVRYSGKIEDWYLKIKPEDFMDNTKYYKKPKGVEEAEKSMDRVIKQFERDLKKIMSDEDVALCKRYRLFNNLLTVKQFKNADKMFKDGNDIKELKELENDSIRAEEEIINAAEKEYNSIKSLEDAQRKLKDLDTSGLSDSAKKKYREFMSRTNPNNDSEAAKTDIKKVTDVIDRIEGAEYTGITGAQEDLEDLDKAERDFVKKYGEVEAKKYRYDINRARDKVNGYLQGRE